MQVVPCSGAECREASVGVAAPKAAASPACMASLLALCFCVQRKQSSSASGITRSASGDRRRTSAVIFKGRGAPRGSQPRWLQTARTCLHDVLPTSVQLNVQLCLCLFIHQGHAHFWGLLHAHTGKPRCVTPEVPAMNQQLPMQPCQGCWLRLTDTAAKLAGRCRQWHHSTGC